MTMQGILNLNKPIGATSMSMVRLAKRITGQRKIGHGGTLDPMASGVLPLLLGQATHMMDYLIEGTKIYRARILLGVTMDTLDAMGSVVAKSDPTGIKRMTVEDALEGFKGTISQVPPMHSALKYKGTRLYSLARAGVEIPREARSVEVFRIDLTSWDPPQLTVDVECGRGVYIRALADDLGRTLGCGGHLTALERLRTGPFSIADSLTPEELSESAGKDALKEFLQGPDVVVQHLRAAVVDRDAENQLRQGRQIILTWRESVPAQHQELCRIYSSEERFVALARYDKALGIWQPIRVFDQSEPEKWKPQKFYNEPPPHHLTSDSEAPTPSNLGKLFDRNLS
jgi:tRNA pseudouridine55 synthase